MMDVKVTIKRDVLNAALGKVSRAAVAKSKIRILQNLLISLERDLLTVVGTDLEIVVTASVPAEHASPGASITVIADLFSKLINDFPPGSDIVLSWNDADRIEVKCGRSRFKVNALPASDFPQNPDIGETVDFTLAAGDLRRAFATVAFAISTETTRFYLCGIYLHCSKSQLVFVTTNGHKLARLRLPKPAGCKEFAGVIIPSRCVNEITRLIDTKAEGEIELRISKSGISFGFGNFLLQSKLIDATFPDYQRVIPTGNDKIAVIDFDDLSAAICRVRTVADRTEHDSKALRLNFSKHVLSISTRNADAGEGEETLSTDPDDAACELEIGFNGEYLASLLTAIGASAVRIRLADAGSPTLFEGVGRDEADFVLMPMRV